MSTQFCVPATGTPTTHGQTDAATPAAPDARAQRREALARANAVRTARAELKRAVAGGRTAVATVVLDPPEHAATMTVAELLAAQHRWGDARARRLLTRVPMSETRVLGALTPRERRALTELLG